MDPAPAPDSVHLAFAARGWIWVFDPTTGKARRVTKGSGMDSRPAWSPDGKQIAFVRDDGSDTHIVMLNLDNGEERIAVDEIAIELDPVYSKNGQYLYYSSSIAGSFDIWRLDLETGERQPLTADYPVGRSPKPGFDENTWLYLQKFFAEDAIVRLEIGRDEAGQPVMAQNKTTKLTIASTASQGSFTVSPDGESVVYSWPEGDGHELRRLDVRQPAGSVLLTKSEGMPLMPAWSADGQWIWFAEGTSDESTVLRRISPNGGPVETIEVKTWNWGEETARVRIRTSMNGVPTAARLNVLDELGHPAVPASGSIRFDGRNGRVFFYSPGELEIEVPAGEVQVSAVHGLLTKEEVRKISVGHGEVVDVEINLEPVWNPAEEGWYAGDHHFHLNYGGPYLLDPEDILLDLKAEAMDVGIPLLANLHNRYLDQSLWHWRDTDGELPLLVFGQEIRSHFLGHLNLIGIDTLYWPWVWGPGYEVYGDDDRTNGEVLDFAQAQGGLGGYVHPVSSPDPFWGGVGTGIPRNLIADAVLGKVDLIEVGCLWTSAVGTAEVWHRLLNLGIPVAASAGTDVMNNFYRTMAIGTTRMYVKLDAPFDYVSYLDALKKGHSFVTNGPMLEFDVNGVGPGGVVPAGEEVSWSLDVHSAVPYDSVEVFVNGTVVWKAGAQESYGDRLELPSGGWVSVRVRGESHQWPMMDGAVFAQTSPIWIGEVGSTEPIAARQAAQDLLKSLELAEESVETGYQGAEIPRLKAHFQAAKEVLGKWVE